VAFGGTKKGSGSRPKWYLAGPGSAITGVSKVARDITERKRAAAALAAQQEWFRVTLASIGDGIIASDPEGRVTYMNGIAETLTGWTNENAQGMPLADVFQS